MKEMYEGSTYADNNPGWHEEDSPWKAKQIRGFILDNNTPHKTICEVGCGTGEILLNLERDFPDSTFVGYDISPHAIERAKSKHTDRTSFFLEDLVAAGKTDFDLLLVIDVIEHVEDYIAFIKSLKPIGRRKIFHIPLDLSAQSVFRQWPILNLRRDVGHLHYFFKESALATLRDCGYTILDHRYTASRLELPNQAFTSRLMRQPRRLMYAINPDFAVRLLGGYSLLVLAE